MEVSEVDRTKISFKRNKNKELTIKMDKRNTSSKNYIITDVIYEDKPLILMIPENSILSGRALEIYKSETEFLSLLDYIQQNFPKSNPDIKISRNIYINHPHDSNGPVIIPVDDYPEIGIRISIWEDEEKLWWKFYSI